MNLVYLEKLLYRPMMYVIVPLVSFIFIAVLIFFLGYMDELIVGFITLTKDNVPAVLLLVTIIIVGVVMVYATFYEIDLLERNDIVKFPKYKCTFYGRSVIIYAVIPGISMINIIFYDIWIFNAIYIIYTFLDVSYRRDIGEYMINYIDRSNGLDKYRFDLVVFYEKYPHGMVTVIRVLCSIASIVFYLLYAYRNMSYLLEFSYYLSILALIVNEIIIWMYRIGLKRNIKKLL